LLILFNLSRFVVGVINLIKRRLFFSDSKNSSLSSSIEITVSSCDEEDIENDIDDLDNIEDDIDTE